MWKRAMDLISLVLISTFLLWLFNFVDGELLSLIFLVCIISLTFLVKMNSRSFADWVKEKEIGLPKLFSFIGGLVTPLLPRNAFINKNYEGRIKEKRVISVHEKAHLERLLKHGDLLMILVGNHWLGLFLFTNLLKIHPLISFSLSSAILLTLHERATNKLIERKFGLNPEPKERVWAYYLFYLFFYFVLSFLVANLLFLIKYLVGLIL